MKNAKTLVTLDFDGTVSPIDADYDFKVDQHFSVLRIGGFRCAVRNKTFDFINELAANNNVDVIWASSWCELTQFISEDTKGRIPHFDYIDVMKKGKAEAILDYAVDNGYENVHIFEDNPRIKRNTTKIKEKQELDIEIVFHKCLIGKGITDLHIRKFKKSI